MVWDWRKVIGPLTDLVAHGGDPADAFDVVVPSLPGFGLSVPLTDTGFGRHRIADVWQVLVTEVLGCSRYAAGAKTTTSAKLSRELCAIRPQDEGGRVGAARR
jgi:pimeloyl-ACP methyl ester carboxylesterase